MTIDPRPKDSPTSTTGTVGRSGRATLRWALVGAATLSFAAAVAVGGLGLRYWALEREDAALAESALQRARAHGALLSAEEIAAFYPTSPEIEATTQLWKNSLAPIDHELFGTLGEDVAIVGKDRDDGQPAPPRRDAAGRLQEDEANAARKFVGLYREAIDAAREAARAGHGVARYEIRFEDHVMAGLDHARSIQALADLLRLDAELRCAEGDADAACDDLLTTIAAGESLRNEPMLVSQLVRIKCATSAKRQAAFLFAHAEADEERLLRIQRAFASIDFEPAYPRALQGERYQFVAAMRGTDEVSDKKLTSIRKLRFRGRDLATGLELFRRAIDASRAGLLPSRSEMLALEKQVVRLSNEPSGYRRHAGTIEMTPWFDATVATFLNGQAGAVVGTTAAACERYRAANGELPESLERLVPAYLSAVPVDPCSGGPLSYVLDERGATIYSIGQDGVDDLGELDRDTSDSPQGDVLIRLPLRKPAPATAERP